MFCNSFKALARQTHPPKLLPLAAPPHPHISSPMRSLAARDAAFCAPAPLSRASRADHARCSSARRERTRVRADVQRSWRSTKTLKMPLKQEHALHTFEAYISDGERVMGVTFPDGRRREKLDATTWRVRLLPFDFLGARVTVYSTLTLTKMEEGLTIGAKQLEFVGLPKEMELDGKVRLTMEGALRPPRGDGHVNGDVTLTLDAAVNDFVAMNPALDFVVNGINNTVLANLQGSIEKSLLEDYARWWRQCERLERMRAERAERAAATKS